MSILGTPQNYETAAGTVATTFAADAGSSRLVGLVLNHEQTGENNYLGSVTLGGQAATFFARANNTQSAVGFVEFWYILESAISNIGSNPTLTVTNAAGGNAICAATLYTIGDCDQNPANWTSQPDSDTAAVGLQVTLPTTSGGTIIGGLTQTAGGSSTNFTGVTEVVGSDRNFNGTLSRAATFYATPSSTSSTIDGDSSSTSTGTYQVMLAVGIPPAASGLTAVAGSGAAVGAGSGTLTTPAITLTLRDIDSNVLKNAVTYANVHVVDATSRGTIAASLTSKTTSAAGVLTLRAPGISTIGATYDVAGWNSDGSDRFHASAVCADL